VLIVGGYWAYLAALTQVFDLVISSTFMLSVLGCLALTLAFLIWWLASRRISWSERLVAVSVAIAGGTAAVLASMNTMGALGAIFFGLPLLFTIWIVWLLVSRPFSARVRRVGLVAAILLVWASISLVRVDGLDGHMIADVHWRWTPTDEQLYLDELAGQEKATAATLAAGEPLALAPGDWPGFRGPGFLGEQEHEPIATNWTDAPPKPLWERRVGPAWSSFVVIGDRLYTQEQRGNVEATLCLDAATGKEIWAHTDRARFWDGQAGAGPRGTPTFDEGRLYTYGATGLLDCLDAASGKLIWTRDVVADTAAPLPMWGFSSSPLVANGLVVVYAGGPNDKGLVAYRADSGEPAWNVATGPNSYSSAQLVEFADQPQVVLLSDLGVVSVAADSGKPLWRFEADGQGIWRVVQPRQVGDDRLLVGSEDLGLTALRVAHSGEAWSATKDWATNAMRPAFNDFVVLDGVAYGLDKGYFCAIDLSSGKRLWKSGRAGNYGYGQLLLLRPQNVIVVLSERGEVALVSANPDRFEELGRFAAVEGKTWNHPVVAHGRLYVRNDTQMKAYSLAPAN
jgi:outer membrane protein assembly factor BamB